MTKKKPIPDDCMPKCATCAFARFDGDDAGFCNRYPPVFIAEEEFQGWTYAVVHITDWCGEYRRRVN
jgi:hypothetical protein